MSPSREPTRRKGETNPFEEDPNNAYMERIVKKSETDLMSDLFILHAKQREYKTFIKCVIFSSLGEQIYFRCF